MASLFLSREIRVDDGTLSNAAFVGANTVNGPSPARVAWKSAESMAAWRVENLDKVVRWVATPCTVS